MKELEELSPEALRGLADGPDGLFWFSNYYCGLTLEEVPHMAMCEALTWPELHPETPNVLMCVPRGTYKTSLDIAWLEFVVPTQRLARDADMRYIGR